MRFLICAAAALAMVPFAASPAQAQHILKGYPSSNPCLVRAKMSSPATPPEGCARAIAAAKDAYAKADLYFYWAYSLNDVGNFEAAIPNLDEAARLAPDFVNAYYERSFAHALLGDFDLGLADADKAVQLIPNDDSLLRQRALGRMFMGDFAGELADCEKGLALRGPTTLLLACKGEALVGLGRYAEAEAVLAQISDQNVDARILWLRADAKRMKKYKPKGDPAKRCAVTGNVNVKQADALIADCSWAILQEKNPVKQADYLTYRSMARALQGGGRDAALVDLGLAAALNPRSQDTHFNYGSALLAAGRHQSARREFYKALGVPGTSPDIKAMILLGRAEANQALGADDAALADATEADRIKSTVDSQMMLGQLAYDRGDRTQARQYWLSAWRMGRHDDVLRGKLRRVGVDDPDQAGGK